MKPRTGDVWGEDDAPTESVGSVTTLNKDGALRRPAREFPPGFAGANPGPSYDDVPPKPHKPRGIAAYKSDRKKR